MKGRRLKTEKEKAVKTGGGGGGGGGSGEIQVYGGVHSGFVKVIGKLRQKRVKNIVSTVGRLGVGGSG